MENHTIYRWVSFLFHLLIFDLFSSLLVIPIWETWSTCSRSIFSFRCFYVLIYISILSFSSLSHFNSSRIVINNLHSCWSLFNLLMLHRSNIAPYHTRSVIDSFSLSTVSVTSLISNYGLYVPHVLLFLPSVFFP